MLLQTIRGLEFSMRCRYFPVAGRYYGVTWTLEHEVIFYLLAALVIPHLGRVGLATILACLAAIAYVTQANSDGHIFTTLRADFLAGIAA